MPFWHDYIELLRNPPADRPHLHQDPDFITYRWMIEEYRVSLFAQELGTLMTVSAKRLEKQRERLHLRRAMPG